MSEKKPPSPEDIKREFEDFVKDRFGGNVQFFSGVEPGPNKQAEEEEKLKSEEKKKVTDALNFDLKPKDVKAHLDRFVIQQDNAKKALSIAVCDHYNFVRQCHESGTLDDQEYYKQNVLMLGPTGVGKTYLIKQIAKLIGVPFVRADATRFTEAGYVGANVDDLIRDLVSQANGNIELAQYGIVYLDEADKLASPAQVVGKDVSGRGVQIGLLKLMEETEVDLRSGNDMSSQIQSLMEFQKTGKVSKKVVNTKHILFIVSGAFNGLSEIIRKRLNARTIGITAPLKGEHEDEEYFKSAITQDFVDFGFEPEFVGRLPIRVSCQHLTPDDLYLILKESEGSIIRQYETSFSAYGIKIYFSEPALRKIAEKAAEEKTGARGLMTVCESVLRAFKYELPDTEVKELLISEKTVENPVEELNKILEDPKYAQFQVMIESVRRAEFAFSKKYGVQIEFENETREEIAKKALSTSRSIEEICSELLQSYEHGLNLVKQNTGSSHFLLGPDLLNDPQKLLESLIKDSYQKKK